MVIKSNYDDGAFANVHRRQVVYFVRHAEAEHNIKEREAVQDAIANGVTEKSEQEKARRAVLNDENLTDAPLSNNGISQVKKASSNLSLLNKTGFEQYPAPKLVLVSPLRRALMTATELFHDPDEGEKSPKFIALEALREKRTGYAADERSPVSVVKAEFQHVDCSDLLSAGESWVPKGEDNLAVRERGRQFLTGPMAEIYSHAADSVAVVAHKGWLRELRHTLKGYETSGKLNCCNFDLENWDQTLYKNAEIRVAEFGWDEDNNLISIVSKSVDNAIANVIMKATAHLIEMHAMQLGPGMERKLSDEIFTAFDE